MEADVSATEPKASWPRLSLAEVVRTKDELRHEDSRSLLDRLILEEENVINTQRSRGTDKVENKSPHKVTMKGTYSPAT